LPSNTKLKLPPANTTLIFRAVDNALRADPVLRSAGVTFRSWQGAAADKQQPSKAQCPWVRLTPGGGPLEWFAASTMEGWLYVDVELWVDGDCTDDLLNLWWAVQRALYPADTAARLAFQRKLTSACGAHTGEVKFTQPAFTAEPGTDGHTEARAQLAVKYRFDQNPTAPGF
jgi:hypothetical protein